MESRSLAVRDDIRQDCVEAVEGTATCRHNKFQMVVQILTDACFPFFLTLFLKFSCCVTWVIKTFLNVHLHSFWYLLLILHNFIQCICIFFLGFLCISEMVDVPANNNQGNLHKLRLDSFNHAVFLKNAVNQRQKILRILPRWLSKLLHSDIHPHFNIPFVVSQQLFPNFRILQLLDLRNISGKAVRKHGIRVDRQEIELFPI